MSDRLTPGVDAARGVFAGGRSAACWQRRFRRAAAKRASLTRPCAWVDDLAHTAVPTLQKGPLLGHCLAELLDRPADDTAADVAVERAPQRKPTAVGTPSTTQRAGLSPQSPARRPPSAGGTARRANRDLLQRLAGHSAAQPAGPKALRRAAPREPRQPVDNAPVRTPSATRKDSAAASLPPTGAWRERLTERVCKRLSTADTRPQRPNVMRPRPLPDQPVPSLAAQWAQPVAGDAITTDSLRWLAADHGRSSGKPTATARPTQPEPDSGRRPQPGPTVPAQRSVEGVAPRPWSANAAPREQAAPSAPPPDSGHTVQRPERVAEDAAAFGGLAVDRRDHEPDDERSHGRGPERGLRPAPNVAPPRLAEVLPGLRPQRRPAEREMTPATVAAQQSARREVESVDKLDDLARKLKQILDEESRRHGIDV